MIKKRLDLFTKDQAEFSHNEEAFKSMIYQDYHLDVIQTCWEIGALNQRTINVWISFSNGNRNNQLLHDTVLKNRLGPSLNTIDVYPPQIVDIANDFIQKYRQAFNIDEQSYELFINIYDYEKAIEGYIYGHASKNLIDYLSNFLHVKSSDIMVFYEPAITILVDSDDKKAQLMNSIYDIQQQCYSCMKRYDIHHILRVEHIHIVIHNKHELDVSTLNSYYMKR